MPTYTVWSPAGQLSPTQKAAIAREVTRTHNAVTGAQTFFAQVVFHDIAPGNWFMGGAPLEGAQVYLYGHVRGGRPKEMKDRLVLGLRDAVQAGAGIDKGQVWVYVIEVPPAQMVEYGHVLPEPGQEAAWLGGLPAEDRERMERIGRSAA
jgi:phenylpyruvate tautomerase PptA (4-oxalocrotonate tautomerase family)